MSKDSGKKERRNYRLILFDDNTFEEIRSFQFRYQHIWIALGVMMLINIFISVGILTFKPLVNYMRNQTMESGEVIALRKSILSLEEQVKHQDLYIRNMQQVLSGDVIDIQPIDSGVIAAAEDSLVFVERVEEDEILRQNIEEQELNNQLAVIEQKTPSERGLEYLYFHPPVDGTVSLGFDPEKNHLGIDINAPKNSSVKATLDGIIIFSGWTLETGNSIGIQHSNNLISFYKHNSSLLKKTGTHVQAGEAIAIIGNTGTLSSGPHLHFEMWIEGQPVNPEDYIHFN